MNAIIKRDGRVVPYDGDKIANAMYKAFIATGEVKEADGFILEMCRGYAAAIEQVLDSKYTEPKLPPYASTAAVPE